MEFHPSLDKASIAVLDKFVKLLDTLDKVGLHDLLDSMGEPDGIQRVKRNTTSLMSTLRKDVFKNLTGVSPKRLLLIGGASIIGIYATMKVINGAINYETQRLAIKNGVSEALAQAAPHLRLPPPSYGPFQQS